jgi:subfamily B ATP-binding cassette protein MsbA
MADINSILFETISGISIIKSFLMEGREKEKFNSHNYKFYKVNLKSVKRILAISPMTEFVGLICCAFVLWIGGRQVVNGALSPGAFITFLAALLATIKPVKQLSRVHTINQQALAAVKRIFEILDKPVSVAEAPQALSLPSLKDKIIFDHIWFGYETKNILKDINIEVKKGEVLAIVGPSGAGKTTLVNLLLRFYDPTRGQIKIDGLDIRQVKISDLRQQIGLVSQETFLFNDTVASNVGYGCLSATGDEIKKAAIAARADGFIMRLPQGYNTIVGDRGFRLSGGEKQRLAIARAILKNPPILILDEATSQLDSAQEILVQEAIEQLMKGRTVLVIAHRLSTIRYAHKIIVLEKGKIAQSGSHEELMASGGLYKKLYEMQFRE